MNYLYNIFRKDNHSFEKLSREEMMRKFPKDFEMYCQKIDEEVKRYLK